METVEVKLPILEGEPDIDDAVDLEDWAPAPEVSDFEAWCPAVERWASLWRPTPNLPWECRECGSTGHAVRDHEGAGA